MSLADELQHIAQNLASAALAYHRTEFGADRDRYDYWNQRLNELSDRIRQMESRNQSIDDAKNPILTDGTTAVVFLDRGYCALIDARDIPLISQHRWHILISKSANQVNHYARTDAVIGDKHSRIFMHRMILNSSDIELTDHANGNGLDNRRDNIRIATHSQNQANKPFSSRNTSGFKGVSYYKRSGRWVAKIQVNRKSMNLGHFDTPEEAARVYDAAARKYFGEYAYTNFKEVPCGVD